MRTMAFVLLLLVFVNSGFTNPNRVSTFESNQIHGNGTLYKGTINNNLKIVMYLEYRMEGSYTVYEGWYYYEAQGEGKKIKLTGNFQSGQLMLTETVNNQQTGFFTLANQGTDDWNGTWSGGGKELPVNLKKF